MTALQKLLSAQDGRRFQSGFADLIREMKPSIVVEAGVHTGTSSLFILQALEDNGIGTLYSIDPDPKIEFKHPRWKLIRKLSVDAMPQIYEKTGPWDVFLHDSDHSVGCMTMEFELAWDFVRPGGIIASDDYTWGEHKAWQRFIERKCAPNPINIADLQYTVRDGVPVHKHGPKELLQSALALANSACVEYGVKPYYPRVHEDPNYLLNIG
jgi:hypothetical protein